MSKTRALVVFGVSAIFALPAWAADPPPIPRVVNGRFVMADGEGLYKNVCAACHMPDAKGAKGSGIYPALAGNPKLAVAAYPIRVVLYGQKSMPALGAFFDDAQIAAVVGYVRTNFGNGYTTPVTTADVQVQRPARNQRALGEGPG